MRWMAVVAGIAFSLISGEGWARDALGGPAGWLAGLGLAVSPGFVYYSRYFIHEMGLVFFTAVAIWAAWRYVRRPGKRWAVVFGAAVGLMYATKETFVFNLLAMTAAWAGAEIWETRLARRRNEPSPGILSR